jgi:hypothetical protein
LLDRIDEAILSLGQADLVEQTHCWPGRPLFAQLASADPDEKIWSERPSLVTAHAILLGDRINTSGVEGETLSTSPLAIRIGNEGIAVLFRYGVVVLIGLSPAAGTGASGKTVRPSYQAGSIDTRKKRQS